MTEETGTTPPPANPAAVGLPSFVVGSIALGLALIGYVPATATGASLPIIFAATGLGLTIAAIWSASLNANAVAAIFAIFAGFWLSYAILAVGLTHNWYGIAPEDAVDTQKLFLLTWLILIVVLTVATLRLPSSFTLLFTLIDIALLLLLLGTVNDSATLSKAGGWVVLVFAALGVYLFLDVMSQATGGKALPGGRPVLGS